MSEGNRCAIDWTISVVPKEPSLLTEDYSKLKTLMELSSLLHLCLDRIVLDTNLERTVLAPAMHLLIDRNIPINVQRMFLRRMGKSLSLFGSECDRQLDLTLGIIDFLSMDDLVLQIRIQYDTGEVEVRRYGGLRPEVDASKLSQAEDLNEVNHRAYNMAMQCVPYVDNPFVALRYDTVDVVTQPEAESNINGFVVDLISPVRYTSDWLILLNRS